jgi:hypothetical protein
MAKDKIVYRNLEALVPVTKLLEEAGKAVNDKVRTLKSNGIPEILGAVGGVGTGAAAGVGILAAGAAEGTAGAAALTSGLATAGSLVGGGMLAGIGVVAAPAVLLGIGGYWLLSERNKRKLAEAKEAALQDAIRKRDAILRELKAKNTDNEGRIEYLNRLVAQLLTTIDYLEADLQAANAA